MKRLNEFVLEKLKVGKIESSFRPKTKKELIELISKAIEENGYKCSLNHIDVSEITDMSRLFFGSKFNGDISNWDVSNVTDMSYMFSGSAFNGDISDWDVSKVAWFFEMFCNSSFNDI